MQKKSFLISENIKKYRKCPALVQLWPNKTADSRPTLLGQVRGRGGLAPPQAGGKADRGGGHKVDRCYVKF